MQCDQFWSSQTHIMSKEHTYTDSVFKITFIEKHYKNI